MTFSRLTLGDPRLKSKLRGGSVDTTGGCNNNLLEGALLDDPGFETAPEDEGDIGEDFPSLGFSWPYQVFWWGGTNAGYDRDWAVHSINVFEPQLEITPQLSTANPRSGSKHVRITATDGNRLSNYMIPLRAVCVDNEEVGVASCRIEPGQLLSMSFWVMQTGADVPWYPYIWGEFLDVSGNEITSSFLDGNFDSGVTVASSYTQNSYSIVAPNGAYWAVIYMGVTFVFDDGSSEVTHTVDMDDFSVTVTV